MNNERLREFLEGRILTYKEKSVNALGEHKHRYYQGRVASYEDMLFYLEQVELGQDTKV